MPSCTCGHWFTFVSPYWLWGSWPRCHFAHYICWMTDNELVQVAGTRHRLGWLEPFPRFPKSKVKENCSLLSWACELPRGRLWVADDRLPCLMVLICPQDETWQVEGRQVLPEWRPLFHPRPWAWSSPPSSPNLPKSFPAVRASKTPGYTIWLGFCDLQQKDSWLRPVNLVTWAKRARTGGTSC